MARYIKTSISQEEKDDADAEVVTVGRVVVESAESVVPSEHPAASSATKTDPARTPRNFDVRVAFIQSLPHIDVA